MKAKRIEEHLVATLRKPAELHPERFVLAASAVPPAERNIENGSGLEDDLSPFLERPFGVGEPRGERCVRLRRQCSRSELRIRREANGRRRQLDDLAAMKLHQEAFVCVVMRGDAFSYLRR